MKNGQSSYEDTLVSVVITTRNEASVIERLLLSIKNQSYKKIEIIVVDNKSKDKTKEISRKYTKFVYDFGPERSAQRNFGAQKSHGSYLLFLDADMELTKDIIAECLHEIENNKNVGAAVVPEESVANTFWEKVKAFERSFYNEDGDETTDAARFFKREAYVKAGGYDETITGPEDWDLPDTIKKLGYKISRVKSIIYHYERIKGPLAIAKKKYYYALKSHRYLKKQGVSTVSAKTLYFLRPVFYRKWYKFTMHPILGIGMIFMLSCELIYGGAGFIIGKFKNL